MAKDFTTFVLGAGLSANYGFPTGAELIQLILQELPVVDESASGGFKVLNNFRNVMNSYLEKTPDRNRYPFRKPNLYILVRRGFRESNKGC